MQDDPDIAQLDAHLSFDLRSWLLFYPDKPLSAELLCHFLTSSRMIINPEVLYPPDIEKGKWASEYKRLIDLDKLGETDVNLDRDAFLFAYYDNLKDLRMDDFLSLVYCWHSDIPFRCSSYRIDHLKIVSDALIRYVGVDQENTTFKNKSMYISEQTVVQTLINVQIPALRVRSDKMAEDKLRSDLRGVYEKLCASRFITFSFEDFIAANRPVDDWIYVSPPELIDLLSEVSSLSQLRERVRSYVEADYSSAEITQEVAAERDKVDDQIKIADFVIGSVNLVLKYALGKGSVDLLKWPINRWLKSRSSWLFAMRNFNKLIASHNNA
jgi:hypothetical protein